MSLSFSSRALRTLRRLARPAISFPVSQTRVGEPITNLTATSLRLTLFIGGEGRTPLARRRLRRALLNISSNNSLPFVLYLSIRYGARSFQDRRFNHPKLIAIRSLLRGERLSLEFELRSTDENGISSTVLQTFLQQVDFVLKRDFGLSLLSPKEIKNVAFVGPSIRLLRLALPPLSAFKQSAKNRTFKSERFRPKAIQELLQAPLITPEQSVIPSIQRPVSTLINSIDSTIKVINPVLNCCSVPHQSILRSLAFRTQKL